MQPIRTMVLVTAALFALAALPPAVAASTPHPLHITKECSNYTGKVGTYCTVTASNVAAIPADTRIYYYGPVLASSVMTSSRTVIRPAGGAAYGYCQVDNRSGDGLCTFWKGTGSLAGFHAIAVVSAESDVVFHWDGRYYIS